MLLYVRVDMIKLLIGLGINKTPQTPATHGMRWIIKANFVRLNLCEQRCCIPPCIDTKLDFSQFDLGHPLAPAMRFVSL